MKRLLAALAVALLPAVGTAQDQSNTILVLDSSGSMWGQIDGTAKVTIAQQVVTDLLATMPDNQKLGLVAYGHREKGNCTDIETIVAPAAGTRDAIAAAVNSLKPLGKTPMTDAVIAAAEALRYTEEKASVILVSDGVETCNPDPCAAARVLEEAGVDFTAHVVGFDVGTDPNAIAQMQCIAAETGGQFRTANNALELADALATVAADPEPVSYMVHFAATLGENGQDITDDISWTILGGPEDIEATGPTDLEMNEGSYTAVAYYIPEERAARMNFTVTGEKTVTVVFEFELPDATLTVPQPAYLGALTAVDWTGPNAEGDYLNIGRVGKNESISYAYTRDGSPAQITLPTEVGTYEMRYIYGPNGETLASQTFEVSPVPFDLTLPETAVAGDTIEVPWTGPDYDLDFIGVGKPGEDGNLTYEYTGNGNPAKLPLPTEEGTYEVRYYLGYDNSIAFSKPITLTPAGATLSVPDNLVAGATVPVEWTGPDYDLDYLAVAKVGNGAYETYVYTSYGNPAMLTMPSEPGEYELRYQVGSDNAILASIPITVGELQISLTPPPSAVAGSDVAIPYVGPSYELDFIGIGLPGEGYGNYVYTDGSGIGVLRLPIVPGNYEVRYYLGQDGTAQATALIEVLPVSAAITDAPDTAPRATEIKVGFDGPVYEGDFIGIGPVGDKTYVTYAYANYENPVTIPTPDAPGQYEVKYHSAQGDVVLASKAITIE